MIIVVGGIKGGSGKTTIATNLTVLRAYYGMKILLVDADEQRSSSDWVEQREGMDAHVIWTTIQLSGKSLNQQIKRMADDYDDIIIDVGGRDTTTQRSALSIADVFLIPFKPRSLDIWTLGPVKTLAADAKAFNPKLKCLAVLNQADIQGTDNEGAIEILESCGDIRCLPAKLCNRKAYANAAADGKGVLELKDMKALWEIQNLYDCIFEDSSVDSRWNENTQETYSKHIKKGSK